jgi:aryl-alcohol dehydrogenase-like predicted oxidoreductase
MSASRRNFLAAGVAMAGSIACSIAIKQQASSVPDTMPAQPMPERVLGKTEVKLPIFGLGGAGQTPLSRVGQETEAIALIEAAFALGIRYFDTAASYAPSEEYLGKVLPKYRDKIFLASKTGRRDRDSAWRELERSLQRLKTDYLDLWQLHHVSFAEELTEIFAPDGAIKALEQAKEQKLVRFSGITGHHEPDVIAEGLRRYAFDTALISLNAADIHHPRPFIPTVLPVAREKNVGVIAMKVPAYGRLFQSGGLAGMQQAMGYVLSLAGVHSCIIAAETVEQLQGNVAVARNFQPLAAGAMKAIEQQAANVWEDVTFYRAWS